MRYDRSGRARQPVGRLTLAQRVAAIFRRFGTDAHVYLPGIGRLNGFDAGNFIDSAGTQPGVVDSPVGLVVNANGSLGVELVSNGDFSAGAIGWAGQFGAAIAGVSGELQITATGTDTQRFSQAVLCVVGRTYQVTGVARRGTTTGNIIIAASVNANLTSSLASSSAVSTTNPTAVNFVFVAPATTMHVGGNDTAANAVGVTSFFDNISVREVPGIQATQATTSQKPVLRQVGSRYHWEFDGVNDSLSLGSVPFQMGDDHAVIAGAEFGAAGFRVVFGCGDSGSSNALMELGIRDDGLVRYLIRDNALNTRTTLGGAAANSRRVVTGGRKGSSFFARVAGGATGSSTTDLGATTLNSAAIGAGAGAGAGAGSSMLGSIYPVIAIKGTVPDADLLLIERFVGQLSGVSL